MVEPTGQQRGVLPLWFSLEVPVSRRAYWASGVLLALLKYAVDAALVYVTSHKLWSPRAYWRLWTDALIHQIHERVLVHIQRRSEHAR